jgi:hypothetical protein
MQVKGNTVKPLAYAMAFFAAAGKAEIILIFLKGSAVHPYWKLPPAWGRKHNNEANVHTTFMTLL